MAAQYTSSSPWYNTQIKNNYLDVLSIRAVSAEKDDFLYTIQPQYAYRPDLLAYDLYGDASLWWVFAARNPNLLGPDPYFNLVAGIGIYIPNLVTLQLTLGI